MSVDNFIIWSFIFLERGGGVGGNLKEQPCVLVILWSKCDKSVPSWLNFFRWKKTSCCSSALTILLTQVWSSWNFGMSHYNHHHCDHDKHHHHHHHHNDDQVPIWHRCQWVHWGRWAQGQTNLYIIVIIITLIIIVVIIKVVIIIIVIIVRIFCGTC